MRRIFTSLGEPRIVQTPLVAATPSQGPELNLGRTTAIFYLGTGDRLSGICDRENELPQLLTARKTIS